MTHHQQCESWSKPWPNRSVRIRATAATCIVYSLKVRRNKPRALPVYRNQRNAYEKADDWHPIIGFLVFVQRCYTDKRSTPAIYGRNTSGTSTEPSSCW